MIELFACCNAYFLDIYFAVYVLPAFLKIFVYIYIYFFCPEDCVVRA